jgi:hypothetical protein
MSHVTRTTDNLSDPRTLVVICGISQHLPGF